MPNLKSTAVKVYPSAFRGPSTGPVKYNPESRLNTEFNVTNITNRLSSTGNFVIDDWNEITKVIRFNIKGYYFEVDLTEYLASVPTSLNVHASIRVEPFINDEDNNTKYKALTLVEATTTSTPTAGAILDIISGSEYVFKGIDINSSPLSGDNIYSLLLLSRATTSESWAVPLTSKLKFKATDVEGLPKINNVTNLTTGTSIYAPDEAGNTSNKVLISSGNNEKPVWSSANTGASNNPVFLSSGVITASNTTVGGSTTPVWLSSGTITASNSTVGSATQPVYLSSGTITAITGSIANSTTGSAATLTTARLFTITDNDATNSQAAATSFNGSANYTLRLPVTIKADITGDISGNAETVTNGVYTTGSYTDPTWLTITKSKVGLGDVENTALSTWAGSSNITTLGTISTGTWSATAIGITRGGTGATTKANAFNALSPMSSLGDIIYGGTSGAGTQLAGNTTTTKKFLTQTGNGTASAAPSWTSLVKSDVGLGNVTNESKETMFTSPVFTGTPTATGTIPTTTNSTQLATTAFVRTFKPTRTLLLTATSNDSGAKSDNGTVKTNIKWKDYNYLLLVAEHIEDDNYATMLIPTVEIEGDNIIGDALNDAGKTYALIVSKNRYQQFSFELEIVEVRFNNDYGDNGGKVWVYFSFADANPDTLKVYGIK